MRLLVTRALAGWTIEEQNGDGKNHPVPITEGNVRLLDEKTMNVIVQVANEAYDKAQTPLPNASSAGSPRLPQGNRSTRKRTAKPTS
jgi:hypothetical protein